MAREWTPLLREAVADATGGEIIATGTHDPFVSVDWLDGAILWLASSSIHAAGADARDETSFTELFDARRPISDVQPDLDAMTRIRVRSTAKRPEPYLTRDDRAQIAAETFDDDGGVVVFGAGGENIWTRFGEIALADHGWIVFSEHLASKVGGATAYPDGAAFQLGRLHEVLADVGVVPGGATLPEIALRSRFDRYESAVVNASERVTVIEGKSAGKGADGARELARHRRNQKPPYLASDAVDGGWLVCPRDDGRHERLAEIGGVTWNDQTDGEAFAFVDAPQGEVDDAARADLLRHIKTLVLDQVLRYQSLAEPLGQAIERCLEDPEMVREYVE